MTSKSCQTPFQKRHPKMKGKSEQKGLKNKPVRTWNGKRGFVIDIACVWVCSDPLGFCHTCPPPVPDAENLAHMPRTWPISSPRCADPGLDAETWPRCLDPHPCAQIFAQMPEPAQTPYAEILAHMPRSWPRCPDPCSFLA